MNSQNPPNSPSSHPHHLNNHHHHHLLSNSITGRQMVFRRPKPEAVLESAKKERNLEPEIRSIHYAVPQPVQESFAQIFRQNKVEHLHSNLKQQNSLRHSPEVSLKKISNEDYLPKVSPMSHNPTSNHTQDPGTSAQPISFLNQFQRSPASSSQIQEQFKPSTSNANTSRGQS